MQMNRVEFEFATPWSIVSHFSREMLSHTSGADSDVFPASSIHPSTTFHLIIIATIPRLLITSFRISTLLRPQTLRRTYHIRVLGPLKDRLADEFMTGPRVVETVMDSAAVMGSVSGERKGGIQCWGHRGASGMFSFRDFLGYALIRAAHLPENTLASYRAAILEGAEGIESGTSLPWR
jgi:hypothetical protein